MSLCDEMGKDKYSTITTLLHHTDLKIFRKLFCCFVKSQTRRKL